MFYKKLLSLFSHGIKKKSLLLVFIALVFVGAFFGAWKIYADNTPVGDIHGIGWSAQDDKGIGWVVLNSEKDASGLSGTPFKVTIDNTNKLSGEGWASIKNPITGTDSYGWLSFDASNPSPLGGDAKARFDPATGKISGWAKFICMAGGCGNTVSGKEWDGWVSLRNQDSELVKYGLCLGRTGTQKYIVDNPDPNGPPTISLITGDTCSPWDGKDTEVNGLAWGGPSIGGWIMFGFAGQTAVLNGITPSGPFMLFPFEKQNVSVVKDALWSVNNISGGNSGVGTIVPTNTLAKEIAVYQAPRAGGPYTIKASSTTEVATTTAKVKFPFSLSCDSVGTSSMSVQWRWSKSPVDTGHEGGYIAYAPQKISITRNGTPTSVTNKPISSLSDIPGTLLDTGLSTSTSYTYALKVDYSSPVYSTSTSITNCVFPATFTTTDTPSKLKAFATDASTIYVNWKDNTTSTLGYKFTVQRMKLTPASSTKMKVTDADDSSVTVFWNNNTTSTPYYNWVERSTSTSNRFLDNLPPNNANNDKAMVRIEYPGNTTPSGSKDYSFYDGGLQDATTYYYRVRACSTYRDSTLDGSYTKEPPDLIAGKVDRPNPVCGKYAPSPELPMVPTNLNGGGTPSVATTTLPKTPTKATSTAVYTKSSPTPHSITLRWNDNSKRETGYQIWRDGILIDERSYNVNATATLTHVDIPANNNKNNSALLPGTNYSYEIRGYYVIPAENGGDGIARVYSELTSTNTTTYYQVDLATSSGGSVTGSGDLASCSGSCTAFFPWITNPNTVTVSATADSDFTFTGWTDVSCVCSPYDPNCNKRTSCTFGPGNSSVTGNFRQIVFTLSASVSRNGKITGSGLDCGTTCNVAVAEGSLVSLSATPNSTTTEFKSWSGKCSGTNPAFRLGNLSFR